MVNIYKLYYKCFFNFHTWYTIYNFKSFINSYGGLLWCFGLFDGPKSSASTKNFGSLSDKTTSAYSRKIDVLKYRNLPAWQEAV